MRVAELGQVDDLVLEVRIDLAVDADRSGLGQAVLVRDRDRETAREQREDLRRGLRRAAADQAQPIAEQRLAQLRHHHLGERMALRGRQVAGDPAPRERLEEVLADDARQPRQHHHHRRADEPHILKQRGHVGRRGEVRHPAVDQGLVDEPATRRVRQREVPDHHPRDPRPRERGAQVTAPALLREHHALRPARRARAVEDRHHRIGLASGRWSRQAIATRGDQRGQVVLDHDHADRRPRLDRSCEPRTLRGRAHERPDPGLVEHVRDLGLGGPDRDRHGDRGAVETRQIGDEPLDARVTADADPLTGQEQAAFGAAGGEAGDALPQLAIADGPERRFARIARAEARAIRVALACDPQVVEAGPAARDGGEIVGGRHRLRERGLARYQLSCTRHHCIGHEQV